MMSSFPKYLRVIVRLPLLADILNIPYSSVYSGLPGLGMMSTPVSGCFDSSNTFPLIFIVVWPDTDVKLKALTAMKVHKKAIKFFIETI